MLSAEKKLEELRIIKEQMLRADQLRKLNVDGKLHDFYSFRPEKKGTAEVPMDQVDFMTSEAANQAFVAANRCGKTLCGDQKLLIYVLGKDPNRPHWKPKPVTDRPFIVWICVPPKFTRDALRDFAARIPPGTQHEVFWAKGEERIEFAPVPGRPRGMIVRIKSYGMKREEFQREAVHIVRFDEEPPEAIWAECEQRLVSTNGQLWLTLTPVLGTTWLHKKLRQLDPKYRCAQTGDFAWFTASQFGNSHLDHKAIALRSSDMTDEEYRIRVLGHYINMAGSQFFPTAVLGWIVENDVKKPTMSLEFNRKGVGEVVDLSQRSEWVIWKAPEPFMSYAIGADVAGGREGDFSCAYVYCVNTGEVVGRFYSNTTEPMDFAEELAMAGKLYNSAVIAVESNNMGAGVNEWLRKMTYPSIYHRQSFGGKIDNIQDTLGWYTDKRSKPTSLKELYAALRARVQGKPGGIIVPDEMAVEELRMFGSLREKRPGSYGLGALSGHDDMVMALAITIQAATQAQVSKRIKVKSNFLTPLEEWYSQHEKDLREQRRSESEHVLDD